MARERVDEGLVGDELDPLTDLLAGRVMHGMQDAQAQFERRFGGHVFSLKSMECAAYRSSRRSSRDISCCVGKEGEITAAAPAGTTGGGESDGESSQKHALRLLLILRTKQWTESLQQLCACRSQQAVPGRAVRRNRHRNGSIGILQRRLMRQAAVAA